MWYSYVASKIEKKKKMEEEVTMKLKRSFSNHCLMVGLNLNSDNVRNCKETTTVVKECEKNCWMYKERNPQFGVKKELFFEKY